MKEEEEEPEENVVDRQYQQWIEKIGGLELIGVSPETDPYKDSFTALFSTKQVEESNTAAVTTIVMFAGVLPFFVIRGLVLTAGYLPESKVGTCLHKARRRLPAVCRRNPQQTKKLIKKRDSQPIKEEPGESQDSQSSTKKLTTNKIYPGTDLDEKREGKINPMTDDDGFSAAEDNKMRFGK